MRLKQELVVIYLVKKTVIKKYKRDSLPDGSKETPLEQAGTLPLRMNNESLLRVIFLI